MQNERHLRHEIVTSIERVPYIRCIIKSMWHQRMFQRKILPRVHISNGVLVGSRLDKSVLVIVLLPEISLRR